ncbi:hypothetical protein LVD17_15380 [Fulvivirga ulvae]|uniref:hypothetical protein n=1 Tax=Fulvivirga ulvae TaxID=2904245 RepID=UPI001F21E289|nr:hypothetical protein [Fulvivirga ulvae]UII29681.1 hypothetical protein LVD17_15380 [Fulvivirga ulvae]
MDENKILDSSEEPIVLKKRPLVITVICIFILFGIVSILYTLFSGDMRLVFGWYPPYLAFCALMSLVCMVGLWKMKKWAVMGYTGLVVMSQIVLLAMGSWGVKSVIIPGIVIVISWSYISRMD